jgi:hypothetical protein
MKKIQVDSSALFNIPMRQSRGFFRILTGTAAIILLAPGVLAGEAATAGAPGGKDSVPLIAKSYEKPAWLADFSLAVKESYDSNVFLCGAGPEITGKAASVKNLTSWITTVSPKITVNLAPLFGGGKILKTLTLGYSPDFAIYHEQNSESYNAHRFTTAIKGKAEAFSFNLENGFTYIDGDPTGPVYPGSFNSCYATAAARERRRQIQDKAKISLQYNRGKWFARGVAGLAYYDLQTALINPAIAPSGYQNYADRYDVNGGVDIGYKIMSDFSAMVGYRYGHQYQQQFAGWGASYSYSSPSDYQRVLFGLEGNPAKWLKLQFQLGPDFRRYAAGAPVIDRNPAVFYGEASATAQITQKDTLAFQFKQWRWVSGSGLVAYQDSLYDLNYTRKLDDKLSLSLGVRGMESDYTCANISSKRIRDDWMVTLSGGLKYAFNSHFSVEAGYSADLGVNAYDHLTADQLPDEKREFVRHILSLAVQVTF